ncbi:MAG: enoyl-CoA hydratase/isomerase family protein [Chloroflexi bacterium]|nr:enoyl-CoA hydratase/isomerase family protein [Chloroflexota bacterium]
MSSAWETVLLDVEDAIATVTLNRPDAINAYNVQMRDDLWDVLGAIDAMPDIRSVIINGTGDRGFCSGADLTEFGTAPSTSEARQVRWERDVFGRLANLRVPTVASLHGHVIGSGLEIAMLCDIRVASEDCRFRMPETKYGLIPAATGTQSLPRHLRHGRALDFLLSGRVLNVDEALQMGLVQRMTSRENLDQYSRDLAIELAALGPSVIERVRRLVGNAIDMPAEQARQIELTMALKAQTGSPS